MDPTSSRNTSRTQAVLSALGKHYLDVSKLKMRDMFATDNNRFDRFSLEIDGLFLDYSKNRINQETLRLLFELARLIDIEAAREQMFTGERINFTENRPVLHTALRNLSGKPVMVDGMDVMPEVMAILDRMADFTDRVHSGEWKGYTGRSITDIVNIGIGGSDLGPKMVTQVLQPYRKKGLHSHFVSNVDGTQIETILDGLDPETTLFIIVSKTFTTQETLTNAHAARRWFIEQCNSEQELAKHFVAVSTNKDAVSSFGIDLENMFGFWDWVGGRYSLWSAVGLSIMLAVGHDHFTALLQGAHDMDRHFRTQPLETNMPVILALIGFWYRLFFQTSSQAILPYDYLLRSLPAYLQQADMESNGKSIDRQGNPTTQPTACILWGGSGINGQHAFYQLLHQGTQMVPVDFIASIRTHSHYRDQHDIMISNVIAQGEALMRGRTLEETTEELEQQQPENKPNIPFSHMVFEGNRPSNTLLLDEITPHSVGMLIALYEHKIFVQGVLWNINSFDQWGVELGKKLAKNILPQLHSAQAVHNHDASTSGLINRYRQIVDSEASS